MAYVISVDSKCGTCGQELPDTSSHSVPEWVRNEVKATWNEARESGSQAKAFRIFERMTDRLGYGRIENNPSLAPPNETE